MHIRKSFHLLRHTSILAILAGFSSLAAAATNYSVNPIDLGAMSAPVALNNNDTIAGNTTVGSYTQAAIWDQINGTQPIGTLGLESYAADINDHDQITGYSKVTSSDFRAYIWDQATGMQDISTVGKTSRGMAINNAGEVVGIKRKNSPCLYCSNNIAYKWTETTGMVELPVVHIGYDFSPGSGALGLNETGTIVGYTFDFYSGAGFYRATHYEYGSAAALPNITAPGPSGTINFGIQKAVDVNDNGQILGQLSQHYDYGDKPKRSFVYENGNIALISSDQNTTVSSINNDGQVIGTAAVDGLFVWENGSLTPINDLVDPAWAVNALIDINDQGHILAKVTDVNGVTSHALLKPQLVTDTDADGVLDPSDNCPDVFNPDQADNDGDNIGDDCDSDKDNDGYENGFDNCQLVANDQTDLDNDGIGDACDDDQDGDGIENSLDNCPVNANPDQTDTDLDGQGDECDSNDDNDNVPDNLDNCPTVVNDDQSDQDGDGIGDACDIDLDGDGANNEVDNCPLTANAGQDDTDGDGQGDACDSDDDNDGYSDNIDNCPLVINDQTDVDGDGQGDACDGDMDGDGIDNEVDNCPVDANSSQNDFDGDGVGDVCDNDSDGDGVTNNDDLCSGTQTGVTVDTATGCSIAQLCPCEGPRGTTTQWRNHGKYVSCTAKSAESFVEQGLITEAEKEMTVSNAANSSCGQ